MSRKPPFEIFPDMDRQPKLRPQTDNAFFKDKLSSQLPVAGTVARGSTYEESPLTTGKISGSTNWVETNPLPITATLLARGQERFNIYCSVCHGPLGDGGGVIPKRGFRKPPSYHDDRLRNAPVGYFFDVITNGFGNMPDYAAQVEPSDRWRIIAYIRALQLSQMRQEPR